MVIMATSSSFNCNCYIVCSTSHLPWLTYPFPLCWTSPFQLPVITNYVAKKKKKILLCGPLYSYAKVSLGHVTRKGIGVYRESAFFSISLRNTRLLSRMAIPIHTPTSSTWEFLFPHKELSDHTWNYQTL